jgi:hypothetical protein
MDRRDDDAAIRVVFHPEWPEDRRPAFFPPATRGPGTQGELHVRDVAQLADLTAFVNRDEPAPLARVSLERDLDRVRRGEA